MSHRAIRGQDPMMGTEEPVSMDTFEGIMNERNMVLDHTTGKLKF
jgi:hypothetical protein